MKSTKGSILVAVLLLIIVLLLVPAAMAARQLSPHSNRKGRHVKLGERVEKIAGSRVPDCSHACGSCSPCRLVMVRFFCASSVEDSETCPLAYKCMCSHKSFPVP